MEADRLGKTKKLTKKQMFSSAILILVAAAGVAAIVQAAAKPVFNSQELFLEEGQAETLQIKKVKKKKIKKTVFKSSNQSVARVTKKGVVTGIKQGTAAITCKLTLKNKKKYTLKCKVTVDGDGKTSENTAQMPEGKPAGNETQDSGLPDSKKPVVYMTEAVSTEGLMAVYQALQASPEGKIAVKLSTGEPGSNYLRTDLIGDLVTSLDGTIVECNTAYGGSRASTAAHYQVAKDHGYTEIADVDIMDEEGSMTLPVVGGENLTENYVGKNFSNYDYYVVLSHFKGHSMAGFGGAVKNISIGIASSDGKAHIHSGGTGGNMWSGEQDAFLESMAEAGKSVVDYLDGNILYINVMNRLSVDCDCDGNLSV